VIRPWLAAACLIACTGEVASAAQPPAWVREAIAPVQLDDTAGAVILLDQVEMTIAADGKVRTSRRYAARLNDPAGREAAALREVYLTGTGRIRAIRGWLIRADGSVRELGNREVVDAALVHNDVFNEVRVRGIGAVDSVARGDVFAAEVESDDQLLFAQIEWHMQGRWPARLVRRGLTLPAGWRADSLTFNAPAIEPRRNGATYVWESRDVPALPQEEGMPPVTDLAARLAVSMAGSSPGRLPGQFDEWADVSAWLDRLAAGSSAAAPAVAARVRALTASATTRFERAAAIARHVQRVQYVSIQTGIGRGGGYAPRPAAVVLERNYGDCKDKAALMRAMLASVGIDSYFVSVFSGDRNYVRAAWPSPQQFNHVVLGIALDDVPPGIVSTLDHPRFGRLLVFDPTDEHILLGELPLPQQGSLGLIVAPADGALVRMPLAPASHHAITREIEGSLSGAGMLSAAIREQSTGSYAVSARAEHLILGPARFQSLRERRIGAMLSNAKVTSFAVKDGGRSAGGLRGGVTTLGERLCPAAGGVDAGSPAVRARWTVRDSGQPRTAYGAAAGSACRDGTYSSAVAGRLHGRRSAAGDHAGDTVRPL
jgi:transglutaminase-like putative cysteine protease